jgi:hypothetical protein
VQEFGLRDLEVLHVLLGPGRTEVPAAWATVPTRTAHREPGLLLWADRVMPWHEELTPERDLWRRYDDAPAAPAPAG